LCPSYVSSDYDITWGPNLVTGSVEVGNPSDPDVHTEAGLSAGHLLTSAAQALIGFSANINYTGTELYGIIGGPLDATHSNAAEIDISQ